MRSILTSLLFLALATPVLAVDGVLEINQTCAVLTGCIDNSGDIGDTPGFPVNIEIPGSYILTSNLVVSDPNTSGLFIAAAPVTIDLNGFEIQGPVNCISLGSTLTCDAGTGRGIRSSFVRTTVVNGSVVKFGSDGIQLGGRSRVERVVVERNGGNGIDVGADSVVIDSRAYRNFGNGIETSDSSTVGRSTSASNRASGFKMATGTVISGSTARDNGLSGISVGAGSVVRGCSANSNEASGILAVSGALIEASSANGNGGRGISATIDANVLSSTANGNASSGIQISQGVVRGCQMSNNGLDGITASNAIVVDNFSLNNGDDGISVIAGSVQRNRVDHEGSGFGLRLGPGDAAYRENVIAADAPAAGGVDGGVNLGSNVCFGSACP
jgi:hypothetical protein